MLVRFGSNYHSTYLSSQVRPSDQDGRRRWLGALAADASGSRGVGLELATAQQLLHARTSEAPSVSSVRWEEDDGLWCCTAARHVVRLRTQYVMPINEWSCSCAAPSVLLPGLLCYGPVWASANISLHVGVPPVCVRVLAPSTSEKKLVWRHVCGLPPAML